MTTGQVGTLADCYRGLSTREESIAAQPGDLQILFSGNFVFIAELYSRRCDVDSILHCQSDVIWICSPNHRGLKEICFIQKVREAFKT